MLPRTGSSSALKKPTLAVVSVGSIGRGGRQECQWRGGQGTRSGACGFPRIPNGGSGTPCLGCRRARRRSGQRGMRAAVRDGRWWPGLRHWRAAPALPGSHRRGLRCPHEYGTPPGRRSPCVVSGWPRPRRQSVAVASGSGWIASQPRAQRAMAPEAAHGPDEHCTGQESRARLHWPDRGDGRRRIGTMPPPRANGFCPCATPRGRGVESVATPRAPTSPDGGEDVGRVASWVRVGVVGAPALHARWKGGARRLESSPVTALA